MPVELDPCSKMKLLAGIIDNFLKHKAKLSASVEEAKTDDDNPGKKHVENYRKEDEDQDKKDGNELDEKSQCCARTKRVAGLACRGFKILAQVAALLFMCTAMFVIMFGQIICTESAQGWAACPNATWPCACPPY